MLPLVRPQAYEAGLRIIAAGLISWIPSFASFGVVN